MTTERRRRGRGSGGGFSDFFRKLEQRRQQQQLANLLPHLQAQFAQEQQAQQQIANLAAAPPERITPPTEGGGFLQSVLGGILGGQQRLLEAVKPIPAVGGALQLAEPLQPAAAVGLEQFGGFTREIARRNLGELLGGPVQHITGRESPLAEQARAGALPSPFQGIGEFALDPINLVPFGIGRGAVVERAATRGAIELGEAATRQAAVPRFSQAFSIAQTLPTEVGRREASEAALIELKLAQQGIRIADLPVVAVSDQAVNAGFKQTWQSDMAQKVGRFSLARYFINLGDPRKLGDNTATRTFVRYNMELDAAQRFEEALMAPLRGLGDETAMWGLDDLRRVSKVPLKEGQSPYLGDILQNPRAYRLTPQQQQYSDVIQVMQEKLRQYLRATAAAARRRWDEQSLALREEGLSTAAIRARIGSRPPPLGQEFRELDLPEAMHYVTRMVIGKEGERGVELFRPAGGMGSKTSFFQRGRNYQDMVEGVEAHGLRYATPQETASAMFMSAYRGSALKNMGEGLVPFTTTSRQRAFGIKAEIFHATTQASRRSQASQRVNGMANRMLRGEQLAPAANRAFQRDLALLNEAFPDAAFPRPDQGYGELGLWPSGVETGTGYVLQAAPGPDDLLMIRDTSKRLINTTRSALKQAKATQKHAIATAKSPTDVQLQGIPGVSNRLFLAENAEIARTMQKFISDRAWAPMRKIETVNGMMLFLRTGFDLGFHLTVHLASLATSPTRFARTTMRSMDSFFNDTLHQQWLAQPAQQQTIFDMAQQGIVGGASEFIAFGEKGFLSRFAQTQTPIIKQIGQLATKGAQVPALKQLKFAERFSRAFTTMRNTMQILEWQAKRNLVPEGQLADLAAHINRQTGVISTRAMGIGATQRAVEGSLIFFAARYTRAVLSMALAATRGGLQGQLARETWGKMALWGLASHYFLAKALGQEPNFDPRSGRFLAVRLPGTQTWVAIGSAYVSLVRLGGELFETGEGLLGTDLQRQQTLEDLKGVNNPFVRWMRGRVAPLTGTSTDILLGRDFIGEPTRGDNVVDLNTDTLKHLAQSLTPFWAEAFLSETPTDPWVQSPADFFGLKSRPLSPWERVTALREEIAQEQFNLPYDQLNRAQKGVLDNQGDMPELLENARAISARRTDSEDAVVEFLMDRLEDVKGEYDEKVFRAAEGWRLGDITGGEFRDLLSGYGRDMGTARRELAKDERFQQASAILADAEARQRQPAEDVAYFEYIEKLIANPALEDKFGRYNFDLAEQLKEDFRQEWGEEIFNYVQTLLEHRRNEPVLATELRLGRGQFRAYWEVHKLILERAGQPEIIALYEDYLSLDERPDLQAELDLQYDNVFKQTSAAVTKAHRLMREKNSVLDAFLFKFGYPGILRHEGNVGREGMVATNALAL